MYIVKYAGSFGFIKPWTAVRDELTFSQQFLTPSIIEGLRQKLGVHEILRHRLRYNGLSMQQERTESRAYKKIKGGITAKNTSIIKRGVLIAPQLILAFSHQEDAEIAAKQHLCLCRNEDVLFPVNANPLEIDETAFDKIEGFEFIPGKSDDSFLAGFNRFKNSEPMFGKLVIIGDPANYNASENFDV